MIYSRKKSEFFWLLLVVFFVGLSIRAYPRDAIDNIGLLNKKPQVQIELLSEAQSIQPGRIHWLGVRLTIPKGYHIYWRNPGTVGLPTSIKWNLPEGFKAGPIHWPTPIVSKMAFYDVWGYKESAFLAIPVEVSNEVNHSSPITLTAGLQWMCCSTQCFPGFKDLSITLPVSDSKPKKNKNLIGAFSSTKSMAPIKSPDWKIKVVKNETDEMISIQAKWLKDISELPKLGKVRFFGYDRVVSSSRPQKMKYENGLLLINAHMETFSHDETEFLNGILVSENGWGKSASGIKAKSLEISARMKN